MMRRRFHISAPPPPPQVAEWEVLPGGMLVQKRTAASSNSASPPVPAIRIRVKHGHAHHEIYLSSQATFGEMKKLLWEKTGLHPQEQRIIFKERERKSSAYLDAAGVKEGSRMVLEEDPIARAKRLLENRRATHAERTAKSLASMAADIDRLVSQVAELDAGVERGETVSEKAVVELTELLMAQLAKLDAFSVDDCDARRKRGMQVRRVQKCVEKLDVIKPRKLESSAHYLHMQKQRRSVAVVTTTTEWETFDAAITPSTPTMAAPVGPRFVWELF